MPTIYDMEQQYKQTIAFGPDWETLKKPISKSFITETDQTEFDIGDIYKDISNPLYAVFRNGILLLKDTDYTVDNFNKKIILSYLCKLNDIVTVIIY